MRYLSSGHSHGEAITVILEGVPSNLPLDPDDINHELRRRQRGFGRGERMAIEHDTVKITGGVLFGKTTGGPITLIIENKDYRNHEKYMDPFDYDLSNYEPIKVPRPGHADLVGALKYNVRDMRIIFERASARETVSRVAVGAICQLILKALGIHIRSFVRNIAGIVVTDEEVDWSYVEVSPVRMPHAEKTQMALRKIDDVKKQQDTCGGIIHVEALNVPAGLGSFIQWDLKLDAKIAMAFLSIQGCKGVAFGDGFQLADRLGSEVHDGITYDQGFSRTSNHYGGFEGGMTNGMPIVVEAVFKPIPTLMRPLSSVHIETKEVVPSHIERSDVCIVPSASVIGEHTLAYVLAQEILTSFPSASMEQLKHYVETYRQYLKEY